MAVATGREYGLFIDGESVDFGRRLHDGDRVAVYPMFERLDLTSLTRLRPRTSWLAVVLGVGFTAGTYVLTDTALKSFDDLFGSRR